MNNISLHIETTARHLTNTLRLAGKVIDRHSSLPILSMILIDGKSVRATDLDMEIEVQMPVEAATGSAAIDYFALYNLIRHVDGDVAVNIKVEGDVCTVAFAGAKYRISSLPASDFPRLTGGRFRTVKIDGDEIKRAIGFIHPFISSEETRYYLNGICLDGRNIVATDGHRMGVFPVGNSFKATGRMILPRKAVSVMRKLPAPVGFSFSNLGRFQLVYDGFVITAKSIDGTFPDWTRVVPKFSDGAPCVAFNRDKMRRAVDRLSAVNSAHGFRSGILAFAGESAVIKSTHPELSGSEIIPAGTASEFSAGLNLRYFSEALKAFPSSKIVTLRGTDAGSPMEISAADGKAYVILMPALIDGCKAALSEALAGVLV